MEVARATAEVLASSATPDRTEEVNALRKNLGDARSDLTALQEVLAATNESIADMSNRHTTELEEATKTRTIEVAKLKSAYESEVAQSAKERSDLASKLTDAQSEIAALKATIGARPGTPTANRNRGHGRTSSGSLTKEEIQKVHEAHNLKMNDLHADYEKKLKELRAELEAANGRTEELKVEVSQKTMEISLLYQDQDDSSDTITRYVKFPGLIAFLGGALVLALIVFLCPAVILLFHPHFLSSFSRPPALVCVVRISTPARSSTPLSLDSISCLHDRHCYLSIPLLFPWHPNSRLPALFIDLKKTLKHSRPEVSRNLVGSALSSWVHSTHTTPFRSRPNFLLLEPALFARSLLHTYPLSTCYSLLLVYTRSQLATLLLPSPLTPLCFHGNMDCPIVNHKVENSLGSND